MVRRVLIAVLSSVGLFALLPATSAQALYQCSAGYYCAHYWYSDATRTTIVAGYTDNTACGGGIYQWGTRTQWVSFYQWSC